ncbi:T9SS type A sorting domain-containing protein, partial [candidate division KSB1 bacterium]|nr:T9SS type A sorting domain-containing protein [candidate division KSB1 bacterium]
LRSGNSDIYAQRINASGVVQWTADGVAICTATNDQFYTTILSDGAGGAIITWDDDRSGSDYPAIYVQRINASGVVQWTADGVAICTATSYQVSPTIVSDGAGGAIITWNDFRSGGDYSHIYAQRINASGVVQWTADGVATGGVAIGPEPKEESRPTIVGDGAGGAIITWRDQRSGIYSDIYAQRINASGVVQWTADGVAIGTATNDQESPNIASDDAGGAIITWQDYRSGSGDIYAQRVRSDGTLGGNSAITAQEAVQNLIDQVEALNKPQGYGLIRNLKVVIARLDDNRIDKAIEMLQQFIDQVEIFIGNGTLKENEGQPLINAANAIIGALSNSSQAAKRNGASEGLTAVALPTEFQLEQNSPNPFNPVTTIQFSVPRESFVRLKVYNSFGAEVATLVDRQVAAGTYKVNWDASRLASGFYLYRLEAEGFAQTKKLLLMK